MSEPKRAGRPPYPLEVRERAVRMVFEHQHEYPSQWQAIESIAEKLSAASHRAHGGVIKLPTAGQTLERSGFAERVEEARTGSEVLDGSGDDHLVGAAG